MNARSSHWRIALVEAVASLPMYDFPELRTAHAELWTAIFRRTQGEGLMRGPAPLRHGAEGEDAWRDPRLLFSQTCGYPLALGTRGDLRVLATPGYRARGCQGPFHRSVILVRVNDPAMNLADLHGRRLAMNAPDSNTGMNLLRAEIAPLARGEPFFARVLQTGAHVRSVAAVAEGLADVAAVDCVTWALLERSTPRLCGGLRVLAWSLASLGLPLVTGVMTSNAEVLLLRCALAAVMVDPGLREARRALLLDACYPTTNMDYRGVARLKALAVEQGYPELV